MLHLRYRFRDQVGQSGFSLMEVLIGIAIFAIGMLALASFQGALTRSTAEAKIRTTAINIAEQIIEGQRGFALVSGGAFSFGSIVDVPLDSAITFDSTMTRNPTTPVGVTYTVTQDVTDYYYDLATDSFTTTVPTGAVMPDYKTVLVNVAWNDDRNFVIDEGTQTTDNLGSGFVEVSASISNVSVVTAAQVSEQDDNDIIAPTISYTPGANPDIVSLALGDQKFKETLTPEPKVYRDNFETRFDVITYSQTGSQAAFLRREEFVAVSCDCTLRAADADNPGKSPAVWAGDEYTEPVSVVKAYGEVASKNVDQSSLCTVCCRDHHDGTGSALYDPSRPTTEYEGGNHKHYAVKNGNYVVAGVGEDYIEACRLVRKDGFFRLGQDFRLEGLNTFPGDYLVTTGEVDDYSTYVTEEVYVENDSTSYVQEAISEGTGYQLATPPPTVDSAKRTAFGATAGADDLTLGYTFLPTTTNAAFQQLRARSIYIDNLSSDLRAVITCIENETDAAAKMECKQGDVELDRTGSVNILELIPFFEIQTTYLNDWKKETLGSTEYSVSNDNITTSDANGPTHSRGLATKLADTGNDVTRVIANRGVTGLTASDPINDIDYFLPRPTGGLGLGGDEPGPGDIEVRIGADTNAVPGRNITITLSSDVGGLKAADIVVTPSNATCTYETGTGLISCFIQDGVANSKITLTNIQKSPKDVYVCSSHQYPSPGELPVIDHTIASSLSKDIDLSNTLETPVDPASPYLIYLQGTACPGLGLGL